MKRIATIIIAALCLAVQLPAQDKQVAKSNLIIREWNVDAATNQKILDHQTLYNAAGRKIEETEYDKDGQKWKKKFEYSADGKLVRELVYNASGKLDNIRKFEFNELGRKKIEYIYDAKGKLKKYKIYEYSSKKDGD